MNPYLPAGACKSLAAALALAAIAVPVSGCGSSSSSSSSGTGATSTSTAASQNGLASKSAQEILAAAKAASASATSVHVSGSVISQGRPISLDLQIATGRGAKGTIAIGGQSVQLIEVGGAFYIQGSESFYRQFGGAAAAQLLKGKWLKAPTSGGEFGSLAGLTDLNKLLSSALVDHSTLTTGAASQIGGQPAITVTDSKGGTLYVATTGPAYPLAISKSGSESGRIVFDKWNEPVTLAPPPDSVDLSQLGAG